MIAPAPKETPHLRAVTLSADEFRQGITYDNWRPRGTSDWLLILTVAGAGRAESGQAQVLAEPGTAILYQPGTPQRYYTDPDARSWHLLWSHFHPHPHWGVWLNWPETARGLRSVRLADPILGHARRAMADTIQLSRHPLAGSMDLAVNALERALLWMNSANNRAAIDDRIRHAVDLLAEKLHEPLSLSVLARDCGLSVSRLAHLFRAQIGMPPQQYLEELRLQRAAQLLRATSLRISEIATEAGYVSAFYFSARFRRKFGMPPSEYRRKR
jgi:AraC family transcriptional regulator of arabinose operon